ncbi:MAG: helix-turn-helix domain-containing protein [Paenarthrobacter ureafaciens]|uniref:PucR family transcriptional regulator n=1 Tax=Paenarthrobacter ureafaciens TaxID=37931 RepID=UPI001AC837B2|nr:PucR family transcriptional regulator [Paenarthrobacter ureafaciens]MBN9128830.1 helix-turn-helix domain-containing protein [Paenarthrobacter ureafaciens]
MYVDAIVQELFTRLRAPLIVLDADMELVAHSIHQDVEHDAAQVAMIVSRRGTTGAIESLERYRVKYSTEPVRIPGKDGGPGHVVVTLRSSGTVTGYLSFPDRFGTVIPPETLRAITAAAARLGEGLWEKSLDRRRGREHVRQLIEGVLGRDQHLRDYAVREIAGGHLLLPAQQYSTLVLGVRPGRSGSGSSPHMTLQQALNRIAPAGSTRSLGVVLGEEAVVIIPRAIDSADLAALLAETGAETVIAAAGGPVGSLEEVRRSHRQARIALNGVLRDPANYGDCASWQDLGDDRLLLQLPFEEMGPEDLPDALRRLLATRNAPMLIEALQAYLATGGNAVEASRRLHLHRSTLYYRLERVATCTGLDLADGSVRQELHLALRVATLMGVGKQAQGTAGSAGTAGTAAGEDFTLSAIRA